MTKSAHQIHPRFEERVRDLLDGREGRLLDTQVRVYARLCKATRKLGEDSDELLADASMTCASATLAIREFALADRLGDEESLREIYNDLNRVSEAINEALGISPRSVDKRVEL